MNYILLQPEQIQNNTAVITDTQQITHIHKILKAKAGDSLKIAVLNGNLGTATVSESDNHAITLTEIQADTPPPPKLPVVLVLCLPRPKALRRIIMDAVAMGVARIYLINSYRVEKSYWQSPHLQRLDEYMKLGLAQAGDTVLPKIQLKKRFKPFVEDDLPDIIANKHALVAHPYAQASFAQSVVEVNSDNSHKQFVFVIGAEGGFIPYELELLTKLGCTPFRLYNRVLRTETAIAMIMGQVLKM